MSRISSQLKFDDLTGGINNTYDKEQINSSTRKTETPDMVNVEYFQLGGIKTMNGNTMVGSNYLAVQDSPVIAGWEYTKGSKRYMLIGLANGEVRRYNRGLDYKNSENNPFELIYKFDTPTDRMSFCNMNNGVVITNGVDDLVFYEHNRMQNFSGVIDAYEHSDQIIGDGTKFKKELRVGDGLNIGGLTYYIKSIKSNTELTLDRESHTDLFRTVIRIADTSLCNATLVNTDTEVDTTGEVNVKIRGLAIQYYKGRLYVGTKEGLFYSPVGLYNVWDIRSDAGVIYDTYNDSSEVTALGLYSDFLLVHKKFNTYVLIDSGSGLSSKSISIEPFSNITCESQQSWIVSNTKYFTYSKDFMDIYPLVQRTVFNDRFLGEPITQKVREIFKNIPSNDVSKIFCVGRPRERQMMFYLPTRQSSGSGDALIYDFQTKSWLLRRLPNRVIEVDGTLKEIKTTVRCAFQYNNNVYIGTEDGLVLKEFDGPSFTVIDGTTQIEKEVSKPEDFSIDSTEIVVNNKLVQTKRKDGGIELITDESDDWWITFSYDGTTYHSKIQSPTIGDEVDSVINNFILNDGQLYSYKYDEETQQEIEVIAPFHIKEINNRDIPIQNTNTVESEVDDYTLITTDATYTVGCDIVANHLVNVIEIIDIPNITQAGLSAYYKSPWFDWAGNYYQSFSEFFIECNSDYKNNFIIRTQADGTSRYEDRRIDEDKFITKTNILVWDDDNKHWGGLDEETGIDYKHDDWAKTTFDTIRMLLPNSIFESFQFEMKADEVGEGFHIYQYGFRRIETEEAPW